MKTFITGQRRGLGAALAQRYELVSSLEECELFINCKHDSWSQVEWLYRACALSKRTISISSNSADLPKKQPWMYAIEKLALDAANEQLFYQGHWVTSVRFGYFDSPRVAHVDQPKMSIKACCETIDWIIQHPYRIKEITVCP